MIFSIPISGFDLCDELPPAMREFRSEEPDKG